MPAPPRTAAVLALSVALALGASGCGSNDPAEINSGGATVVEPSPSPLAALDTLSGVQTAVRLDPAFLEGLTSLSLTPATLGGATLDGSTVRFPITGGNVTYFDPDSGVRPYVRGLINHDNSGLQLTGPNGTVVALEDFVVDPAESVLTGKVTVDGQVFAQSAPLFFLDGRTLEPLRVDQAAGTAVLAGTTVSLTQSAADALNSVFGTDALTEFFPVGVAEITVALPDR